MVQLVFMLVRHYYYILVRISLIIKFFIINVFEVDEHIRFLVCNYTEFYKIYNKISIKIACLKHFCSCY